ncbi:lysine-specific demethylase 3B-like isoform X6 [Planococcus citri]|uniref:lysine-specific demethylase 3B-like isoform X6 n=1 Tax=Planococcus citri TaxID=170843 RepID=UPI0031F8ED07
MEDISGSSVPLSLTASRYTDDRASSDSGISSRGGSSSSSSAGSGSSDERSGSRSSALSSLGDEGGGGGGGGGGGSLHQHHQQQQQHHHHSQSPQLIRKSPAPHPYYQHHPQHHHPSAATLDGVRVWRDPNLLLVADRSVRHIDSVQHQSLLMSHPAVVAGSPSSSAASVVSPASGVAAPSTPAHYPPTVVPMITPHPLHHQLPPHNIYTSPIPEMLWKQQRFPGMPMAAAGHPHLVSLSAEELLAERERAYAHDRERQDRLHREREQEREVEKHKEREREKHHLERERQEKERLEKRRADEAVQEHFSQSLKLASLKQQQQQQQQQQHHHMRQAVLPGPANTPTSASGGHHRQSPLPPPPSHRQSPHHRQSPLPASQAAPSPLAPPQQHHLHHRQSPHSLPPSALSPPDQRYPSASVNLYQKATGPPTGSPYGYPATITGPGGQILHPNAVSISSQQATPPPSASSSSLSKPKVSSPAPHHIYGKPSSGITSGTPVCRPSPQQEISLSPVPPPTVSTPTKCLLTPSPYQQLSQHQPPPSTSVSTSTSSAAMTPPPAHSSQQASRYPGMGGRPSPLGGLRQVSSGLPASSASPGSVSDLSLSSISAATATSVTASHQMQPLDLGVKDSSSSSSSSSPYSSASSNGPPVLHPAIPPPLLAPSSQQLTATELVVKRKWPIDESSPPGLTVSLAEDDAAAKKLRYGDESAALAGRMTSNSSSCSREPSPSSLSVASQRQTPPTITTTVINVHAGTPPPPALTIAAPVPVPASSSMATDMTTTTTTTNTTSSTPPTLPEDAAAAVATPTTAASTLQAPPPPCSSPNTTPAKASSAAATTTTSSSSSSSSSSSATVDSEKSNSPKPPTYGGHKLKKAWLQRHSGEDEGCSKIGGGAASASASSNGSLSITNADNNNDGTNVPPVSTASATTTRSNSPSTTTTSSASAVTTKESNNDMSALTSLNNSINSIGSMAVNSISKSKPPKGSGGKKAASASASAASKDRASPVVLNGHVSPKRAAAAAAASYMSDESSSSETESSSTTTTKSSPKRVPPKVKRKKAAAQKAAANAAKAATNAAAATTSSAAGTENEDAAPKRRKLNSTSSTDSDKESASEKESDNSSSAGGGGKKTSSNRSGGGGSDDKKDNTRKRGRRPKVSGSYSPAGGKDGAAGNGASGGAGGGGGDGPKEKKFKDDKEPTDPFSKPPISTLKKTGESFLQDGSCFEVAPKLAKCRECRWTQTQRSRSNANIFCRFFAFRRLRYTKNGQLAIAGFSDPHKDPSQEDLNLWLPNFNKPPTDLDLEMARFVLAQVGDQFCDLLNQETEAINIHISEDKKIAWKRVVQGVREMCDVCETTLFNFHWACSKCGFVVCIDCYKGRKNGTIKIWGEVGKDRDDLSWLLCTNRQPHEQEKLMLTQIIAGEALMKLKKLVHESRAMWDVPMYCGCPLAQSVTVPAAGNGICKEILRNLKREKQRKAQQQVNGGAVKSENGDSADEAGKKSENNDSTKLDMLANVALNQNKASVDDGGDSSSDSDDGNFSTLRELLVRPNKTNGSGSSQPTSPTPTAAGQQQQQQSSNSTNTSAGAAAAKSKQKKSLLNEIDEVISSVGGDNVDNNDDYLTDRSMNGANDSLELKYFVRARNKPIQRHFNIPIRIMTFSDSQLLYPNTPHQWLCDGKLLRLLDPLHSGNFTIFQDQWKRGQPVIVSDVTKRLDCNLWHPDAFAKDFGDNKNDLINCMTGKTVPNQPMRKFWEGFEYQSKRLKDDKGNAMLLKLKDWPPGEDFAEMLPSRFADLMSVLPLGEYTQRNGKLNLASRLPDSFVRPDLGPKMYNAYGSAIYPHTGTTNLHLDISDAVNVMVYVSIPKDGDTDKHMKEAYRAIDEAGCDFQSRRRARDSKTLPGALWHIYAARDADKIRDLLNKVAIERGARLEPNHDPIHDQSWYLDGPLRERLKKEYMVEGYAIVQCLGDAVFVPAGTPHQVRNLLNCIKIAEDFVSPENVSHCFHLTQEFRDLSDTHSNHEDKLQIKNIMYHAVKDSLSVLGATLNQNNSDSESSSNDTKSVKTEVKVESNS